MLILLGTLFLHGAISAQSQIMEFEPSDICFLQTQTCKDSMEVLSQSLAASSEIKNLIAKSEERINKTLLEEIQKLKAQNLELSLEMKKMLNSSKKLEDPLEETKKEIKTYINEAISSELNSLAQMFVNKIAALQDNIVFGKCKLWKEKVFGLELKRLETGVYHMSNTSLPWNEAVDFCESRGMHLALIETEKEMNLLEQNRPPAGCWVGASDIGRTPGQFFWQDSRPVETTWINSQNHHEAGRRTCLYLLHGQLYDYHCAHNVVSYICEVKSEYSKCF